MSARRFTSTAVALLCALVGLLALAPASGQAFDKHEYLSQFSEVPAEGPHGEPVAVPGPLGLSGSTAATVDSGEVYVAEGGLESRVDKFDAASGAFIAQFPQISSSFVYLSQGVAVGHAAGKEQVYVGADEEGAEGTHGAVVVFDAAGELQKVWTGAGTPSKERFDCFECSASGSVAVDDSGLGWAAGDVYVADPEHHVVDVFEPETGGGEKLVAQIGGVSPTEPFFEPYKVAVDEATGDVLVADKSRGGNGSSSVYMFKPSAVAGQYEFLGVLALPGGVSVYDLHSLAGNDGEGDIYVVAGMLLENGQRPEVGGEQSSGILEFNSSGAFEGRITPAGVPGGTFGAAVEHPDGTYPVSVTGDPETHRIYIGTANDSGERPDPMFVFGPNVVLPDVVTAPASSVQPTSATLNGTVDTLKAGAASCRFEWGTSPAFGEVASCPSQVQAEGKVPVSVALSKLQPDTTYYYRLQATNANGTNEGESGQDAQFRTTGPSLREESASEVASTSVTLEATLNPNEAPTSYYFQYGKSSAYEAAQPLAPGAALGSGSEDVEVSQHVQGLAAGTVYHYRVVAVSELEVEPKVFEPVAFPGPDHAFATQGAGGGLVLPDGRQWELVSPREKLGGLISGPQLASFLTQASTAGGAITYHTTAPPAGEAKGNYTSVQILSTRGAGGWSSQNISLPHATATGISVAAEYLRFSQDLGLGLVIPAENEKMFSSLSPEVSPPDTELTPYLRHDSTCQTIPASCFEPLVTGASGYTDAPSGTSKFGENVSIAGATPDLAHVLLRAYSLEGPLYEWSAGAPAAVAVQPVTVLPPGEGGTLTGDHVDLVQVARHAISEDGSRVAWAPPPKGGIAASEALYLRDMPKGETIRLDAVQGGSGLGPAQPVFQAASKDGSRVFFTDTQHLAEDSGASAEDDLYECEILETAGKLSCALGDLTPGGAGVRGNVLGVSEDGSYVYFVASGALSHGENGRHERAALGAPNLYLLHYDDGAHQWEAPQLIGVLSNMDAPDWAPSPGSRDQSALQPTSASPDGRYLAFMSNQSLTRYDNRDARSHIPDEEVFLFDAADGRLVCASCNPTGARPAGIEYGAKTAIGVNRLTQEADWPPSAWVAAQTPMWRDEGVYQPRYLSDEGRLFFDSSDALVPQDIDGTQDVYEYEPDGVGSCATASSTFGAASGGCVGLITAGTAPGESAFLDASETGDDVFVVAEKLVQEDPDTALDVYDAHVCTSQSPCISRSVPSPECTTADACRAASPPQPAIFGAPSSATFSGAGNVTPSVLAGATQPKRLTRAQKLARALTACHRKPARRRAACERQARKRYGASQARNKVKASKRGMR